MKSMYLTKKHLSIFIKKWEENIQMKFKKSKGITLIALVVTIIVLLILAGISIQMLTGQNRNPTKSWTGKRTV